MPRIKLLRLFSFSTQEMTKNSKNTSQCGSSTRTADGSSRSHCRGEKSEPSADALRPVRMIPAASST